MKNYIKLFPCKLYRQIHKKYVTALGQQQQVGLQSAHKYHTNKFKSSRFKVTIDTAATVKTVMFVDNGHNIMPQVITDHQQAKHHDI